MGPFICPWNCPARTYFSYFCRMKGKNLTIAQIIKQLDIDAINDMQEAVLNAAKNHKDIQVLSPTGTGKTLGYLFPLSQAVARNQKANQALIICPTRELVLQVDVRESETRPEHELVHRQWERALQQVGETLLERNSHQCLQW